MTTRYTDYDNWAWLYNQTMGPDYSRPQIKLLERTLLPYLPQKGHILDLCCGTGQLIQPLVAAGYQVTGLDGSDEMLAYARQNAPTANFLLEDARTFNLPNTFDGVFSTSASLNHLMTFEDLTQVFDRVYASLRPGGRFVFDLNHPAQLKRWWQGRPTEGEISHDHAWMITPYYDPHVAEGAFHVTIFQRPGRSPNHLEFILTPIKHLLYKFLRRPRFIGLRLRLLQNFTVLEPHWKKRYLIYPIKGYSIDAVTASLTQVGFEPIILQTINGNPDIDEETYIVDV
jgi:SAM-dependent methyltransferase